MSLEIVKPDPISTIEFSTIPELINEISSGRCIVLVDDEDRENEGDLVAASSLVTPEIINFMAVHGRGLICITLTQAQVDILQLPMQTASAHQINSTSFTVSVDATEGTTTGISAADRYITVKKCIDPKAKPSDLASPGHLFPIRAVEGGVLRRAGHTEAGCDLARLAGLSPSSVICEIMNEDGTMARRDALVDFAKKHNLKIGTIADLIEYRSMNEQTVSEVYETKLSLPEGEFQVKVWKDKIDGANHVALSKGTNSEGLFDNEKEVAVRVHIPETVQDLIGLNLNPQRWSFKDAFKYIAQSDQGLMLLIDSNLNENSFNQLQSLHHESKEKEVGFMVATASTQSKNTGIGAQILKNMGVRRMKLLGGQTRYPSISGFGLEITGVVSPENKSSS